MGDRDYQTVCRKFLEEFCDNIDNFGEDRCQIPFRLVTLQLVPSELEGECLEWIRRYLIISDCPSGLLSQLTRAVYRKMEDSLNLSQFYLEIDDKVSKSDEDGDHSASSSEDGDVDTSSPQQLDAEKLVKEVVSFTHTMVKTWNVCPPVFITQPNTLQVYSHAIKNTRRKMEDRHVLIPDLNVLFDLKDSPNQSYYAVFDGHGGLEAAEYAATHLHLHLVNDQQFHTDPEAAMVQAYKTTDIKFLEKAKRERLRSGTTGVSVLFRESEMCVGWLGDSQALLVSSGRPVQIMSPHKPEREDERRRIEDLGGCVLHLGVWRVNGTISVSRAIGDALWKPFVSSDADVVKIPLTGEEEYLVLACDGLWDVVTPTEVTNIVYNHSKSNPGEFRDVAVELVNVAREAGSNDNISVIVILFKSILCAPKAASAGSVVFGLSKVSEDNAERLDTSPSFSKSATLSTKVKSRPNGKPQEIEKAKISVGLASSCKNFHSKSREAVLFGKGNCKNGFSLVWQERILQKSVELNFVSLWRRLGCLLSRQMKSVNKRKIRQPSIESRYSKASTYRKPFSSISLSALVQAVTSLTNSDMCQTCQRKLKLIAEELLQGCDNSTDHWLSLPGTRPASLLEMSCLLLAYSRRLPAKCNIYCMLTLNSHYMTAQQESVSCASVC